MYTNMAEDTAPLVLSEDDKGKSTLLSMVVNGLYNIKYKSLIFLFILFILITSDVFVNLLLKKINGAVDDAGCASPYGTIVQGLALVIGYMILNFFIDQGVI